MRKSGLRTQFRSSQTDLDHFLVVAIVIIEKLSPTGNEVSICEVSTWPDSNACQIRHFPSQTTFRFRPLSFVTHIHSNIAT